MDGEENDMEPKQLIEAVAKALVEHPEAVVVREVKGTQVTVLELVAAKEDVGKLIGRGGHTAMAMRHILTAVAGKLKRNVLLEIVD